jgi:hypothetical protein
MASTKRKFSKSTLMVSCIRNVAAVAERSRRLHGQRRVAKDPGPGRPRRFYAVYMKHSLLMHNKSSHHLLFPSKACRDVGRRRTVRPFSLFFASRGAPMPRTTRAAKNYSQSGKKTRLNTKRLENGLAALECVRPIQKWDAHRVILLSFWHRTSHS